MKRDKSQYGIAGASVAGLASLAFLVYAVLSGDGGVIVSFAVALVFLCALALGLIIRNRHGPD